ncbi:MAG: amidohydrolase family protein, partial [Actinomycetota bacterium]
VNPRAIVYDMLMENAGRGYVYLPLLNYTLFNFDHVYEMLQSDRTVLSLSDGGAHCGVLCDASVPTYMLAYMSRDRTKGPTLPLEFTVHKMTSDTAKVYGLHDRGVVAPGYKADLNLIDFDALALHDPEMVWDLPAGGRRLVQRADGYVATICAGEVTYQHGQATGATPGRLIRGGA